MRKLLQVLIILGFIEMTVFSVIYATDLSKGIILDIPQEKLESSLEKYRCHCCRIRTVSVWHHTGLLPILSRFWR